MLTHDPLKVGELGAVMHQFRRAQANIEVEKLSVQTMTDEAVNEYIQQRVFLLCQMETVLGVLRKRSPWQVT